MDNRPVLLDQKDAIRQYLDTLLQEVPDEPETEHEQVDQTESVERSVCAEDVSLSTEDALLSTEDTVFGAEATEVEVPLLSREQESIDTAPEEKVAEIAVTKPAEEFLPEALSEPEIDIEPSQETISGEGSSPLYSAPETVEGQKIQASYTDAETNAVSSEKTEICAGIEAEVQTQQSGIKLNEEPATQELSKAPATDQSVTPAISERVPKAPETVEPEKKSDLFGKALDEIDSIKVPLKDDLIDGIPQWAYPSFQCLFFYVGIIKLAVPLIKLNGVVPFSDNCVKPPQSPDWYCGVMIHRGEKLKVIDTAELVVPPEYEGDEVGLWPNNVLKIGENSLGISCTKIGEVKRIDPKTVKWRKAAGGKRPWLLGTIKEHLCVLLDSDGIIKMIKDLSLEANDH